MRHQVAIYLEDLDNFRQVRPGNSKDLEQFADLLDIAIINLKETNQHHELGNGSLYAKLQRKLPQFLLASYRRWIFENNVSESVGSLRRWVIQESEFQTEAAETVYGVSGRNTATQGMQSWPRQRNARTFFADNRDAREWSCQIFGQDHPIWKCQAFIQKSISEKWDMAKRFQLCFRCLDGGHPGIACPRSRPCEKNGCKALHHRLLHRSLPETKSKPSVMSSTDSAESNLTENQTIEQTTCTSVTEGNEQLTTMTANDVTSAEFIALRTVPVVLKNGNRSLKVNALLDDASTKTYVNADVAAELGLQGQIEKVKVNVLNGQVETFETTPVDIEMESVTGDVKHRVTAYTATRVIGTMSAFDWSKCTQRWSHLRNINFPRTAKRSVVDVLIGIDCADLHCAIQEVRGRPGEPIARLAPLGWTCIGYPGSESTSTIAQTHFASTYFVKIGLKSKG